MSLRSITARVALPVGAGVAAAGLTAGVGVWNHASGHMHQRAEVNAFGLGALTALGALLASKRFPLLQTPAVAGAGGLAAGVVLYRAIDSAVPHGRSRGGEW